MDKWAIVHDWRRRVARGLAEPRRCPEDRSELVPSIGLDDEPVLRCMVCRSVLHLGLNDLEAMRG